MKNDIPALDDLMQGINDPDIILANESPDMLEPTPQSPKEEVSSGSSEEAVLSPQVGTGWCLNFPHRGEATAT